MGNKKLLLKKRLKRWVSARNIIIFFIPVSTAFLLTMVLNLSSNVQSLSDSLIERTSKKTEIRLENFISPVKNNLDIIAEWCITEMPDISDSEDLNKVFIPILEKYPQITSMLIADENSNEYMLLGEDGKWQNRITRAIDKELSVHRFEWEYNSFLEGKLLKEWKDTTNYDPANRPWYQRSFGFDLADTHIWTGPYVLYTTKEPGVTLSMLTKNKQGKTVVIAFDVLLYDISLFTTSLDISDNGFSLIITEDLEVVGLPGTGKFMETENISENLLKKADLLEIPVLNSAIDHWIKTGKTEKKIKFKYDNKKWRAGFIPVQISGNKQLYSVVLVPEKDFMTDMNRPQLIFFAGILLIIILVMMIIIAYLQKQKINLLLLRKKLEIQKQKEEIELKNAEISEGIIYSRRIQSAILPNPDKAKEILPSHFIYYKPKKIVSGDFYWIERRANKLMFAAVDCTGHGVPGALMSIIGYEGLNRAINEYEITKSDKIVNTLNESLTETLRNTGSVDIKDGMDIALCVINKENNQLEYTGAKNPLYIIRKSNSLTINGSLMNPKLSSATFKLFEIKPDRMSIEPANELKRFTAHRIQLKKDDRIFIFSDGYANQFGGELGKKYSYAKFRQLLLDLQSMSFKEQKNQLEIELGRWQGNHEQIDDILIMGVQF